MTEDITKDILAGIASRDLQEASARIYAIDAMNEVARRTESDDGYKTIPISGMNMILIFMHVFSVVGVYLILTFPILWPLTIGVGIAIAFSIIFDIIVGWDYVSDKYKVRFK